MTALRGLARRCRTENLKLLAYDSLSKCYRERTAEILEPLFHDSNATQTRKLFNVHPLGLGLIVQFWPRAKLTSGDKLFFSGNWWWRPEAFKEFSLLKAKNSASVYVFLHDLIPIAAPQFVDPLHTKNFISGFVIVAKTADVIITNSEASKKDILRHLDDLQRSNLAVKVTPLAHEFVSLPDLGFHPLHALFQWCTSLQKYGRSQLLAKILTAGPFVLMVGTIENRKNVPAILKVWKRLLERSPAHQFPQLVLVGKWGQGAPEIQSFLRQNNNIQEHVTVLERIMDSELKRLYEHCIFTVYISHYEGWGLPIGESLWFGKPVLASNMSAMGEVGGEGVTYVDPADESDIERGVLKMLLETEPKRKYYDYLRPESDFCDDLSDIITE